MSWRITTNITRTPEIQVTLNGDTVTAHENESIAAVLLICDQLISQINRFGQPRAPLCNMGTCYECLVQVRYPGEENYSAVRSCLTPVAAGMDIKAGREIKPNVNVKPVAGES
ncbi:(2Fe-2S)-binding protein [Halioxenophilus aromaticivorans]|uniref:(2Fe-2S)-binding protein n=1 Tax=Halioxenophilus aromaticivorans TaxID=1306992 RepID=A0AAV3TY99_9ALTE